MKYDIGIIGGGPAGYSAAFEAARNGLHVVLFEKDKLGGTCLNRGCIPTKYLLHAASLFDAVKREPYIKTDNPLHFLDSESLQRGKEDAVESLRQNLERNLLQNKIEIITGQASVKESGTIICNDLEYQADKILIATGVRQKTPFAEGFITSNELLELKNIPKTMKIVGGGTIAVEFAYLYASLGTKVTIQIRGDRLLRTWSKEISRTVETMLKQHGVSIEKKCVPEVLQKADAEICLSAVGMIPEISGIDRTLFDIGDDGGIVTDIYGETKTAGIYAAGDVRSGSEKLAHTAMADGRKAVHSALSKKSVENAAVVRCIYLVPEIADVGIDEETAEGEGLHAVSIKTPLYSNSMNVIAGGYRSFIRLTADSERKILIGAQIVSEHASDMITELALAINNEVPVSQLTANIRPHPSFSEGVTDAVRDLEKALE